MQKTWNNIPFNDLSSYGEQTKKLGSGISGGVYLYKTSDTGPEYAVKEIQQNQPDLNVTVLREIGILTRLSHPNIAKIIDVDIDDKYPKIVMEMATGNLADAIKLKLTSGQIRNYIRQLSQGLSYMHSMTIWHRDIKPDNILLYGPDLVKLTDFGLSRFGALPGNMYTTPMFTALYRPPEIFLGAKTYDGTADIWALGVVMAEMAKGSLVFGVDEGVLMDPFTQLIQNIVRGVGGMTENQWPGISGMKEFHMIKKINEDYPEGDLFENQSIINGLGSDGVDLLRSMLTANPSKRYTIKEVLEHPYIGVITNQNNVCGHYRMTFDPTPIPDGNQASKNIVILTNWMHDVKNHFKLSSQTFFYARNLLDKYLSLKNIDKNKLQLVGGTVLLIASKIYDIYAPVVYDLVFTTNRAFTTRDFVEMERDILKTCKFQIAFPNLHEYIQYLSPTGKIIHTAEKLGEYLFISANISWKYSQSDIASALVLLAQKYYNYIDGTFDLFPSCIERSREKYYTDMGDEIIKAIKSVLADKPNNVGKAAVQKIITDIENTDKGRENYNNYFDKGHIVSVKYQKLETRKLPIKDSLINESPKLSGERLSKTFKVVLTRANDVDTTREDLGNFVNGYVMNRALEFARSFDYPGNPYNKDFSNYFDLQRDVSGKYVMGRNELERITYELGPMTVATTATINFNYVLPDMIPAMKLFFDTFDNSHQYSDMKLMGYLTF